MGLQGCQRGADAAARHRGLRRVHAGGNARQSGCRCADGAEKADASACHGTDRRAISSAHEASTERFLREHSSSQRHTASGPPLTACAGLHVDAPPVHHHTRDNRPNRADCPRGNVEAKSSEEIRILKGHLEGLVLGVGRVGRRHRSGTEDFLWDAEKR